MITRPLELQQKLAPPPRDFDVLFWINAGAIALFFALLGSRFVLAPGVPVGVGATLELPRTAAAELSLAEVVVSYRRDNMILFEGGVYELTGLRPQLEAYARKHPGARMIVRGDRQVSLQGFTDLCQLAREVGFAGVVVLATLEDERSGPQFVPGRR